MAAVIIGVICSTMAAVVVLLAGFGFYWALAAYVIGGNLGCFTFLAMVWVRQMREADPQLRDVKLGPVRPGRGWAESRATYMRRSQE